MAKDYVICGHFKGQKYYISWAQIYTMDGSIEVKYVELKQYAIPLELSDASAVVKKLRENGWYDLSIEKKEI